MEPVITGVFEEFAHDRKVTSSPWPHFSLCRGDEEIRLRQTGFAACLIVMQNASEHFRGSNFKVFARLLETPKNEV